VRELGEEQDRRSENARGERWEKVLGKEQDSRKENAKGGRWEKGERERQSKGRVK
jgi:hypothetical protein